MRIFTVNIVLRLAPALLLVFAMADAMAAAHEVRTDVHHDQLPSLRNAKVQHVSTVRESEAFPVRTLPSIIVSGTEDAVVQSASGSSDSRFLLAPTFGSDVLGVGKSFVGPQGTMTVNSAPPDTSGAIGATQYVQVVNSSFAVFDKATKAVLYGPVSTKTLWAGFGGSCESNNSGDGTVVYDKAANRWIIAQFAVSGTPYLQCVAVSQTSDALGAYNRYSFSYGTVFPDYPKMGVWPDGYYETFNMFNGGVTFAGAKLCAYDRTAMLSGAAATQQCFQLSTSYGGVLPSDLDGSTAPPAGSPNYMLNFGTAKLNLWKFHVDWVTPTNTTLTGPTAISVSSFSSACPTGSCVKQLGTTQKLAGLGDRLMYRLAYRNFGDHEALVVSHSVKVSKRTGVRWYEIRSPATTPVVFQQSTFSPDTSYRWMPSIAMDKQGNIAVGYSVSSGSINPAIRYTGRLVTDPLNTLQTEATIFNGTGSQTGGLYRWGDYSQMTVDPVDDCTFWYGNEYLSSNGSFNWSTRIASFKYSTCQ